MYGGRGAGGRRPLPLPEGRHRVPEGPLRSGTSAAQHTEQSSDEGQGVRPQVLAVCALKGSCRQAGWAGVPVGQEAADVGEAASGSRTGGRGRSCFHRLYLSLDTEPWPCPSLSQGSGTREPSQSRGSLGRRRRLGWRVRAPAPWACTVPFGA